MNAWTSANLAPRARIMVVEPPSVFREMQALMLQGAGFAATNFDDIGVALQGLRAEPFDVIVLNSDAPELETFQFVARMRREFSTTPLIHVAPALTVEITRELSRLGVAAVLQRPLEPKRLIEKIDEVLGTDLLPNLRYRFDVSSAAKEKKLDSAAAVASSFPPFTAAQAMPVRFSSSPFLAGPSAIRIDSVPPFRSDRQPPSDFESAHPFNC